jgi:hypothetical protein
MHHIMLHYNMKKLQGLIVSDCCLTPTQQIFNEMMMMSALY